ncbi:MAG TPA: hypothetical protein VFE47_06935 [Tepidisphaeraceae bacterium]|nr:hypothetical protein [Tepidisphaeraceae bacterium]
MLIMWLREYRARRGEMTAARGPIRRLVYNVERLERRMLLSGTAGEIFVSNQLNGTIGEYTTDGAAVNPALISGLGKPGNIAVSGSDLFVASETNQTIGEYTTTGATVNARLIQLSDVNGIAIAGSDLFVTDYVDGTVSEYTTSGVPVGTQPLITGLKGPGDIAVSGSDLFVAESNGNVRGAGFIAEYTTSGELVNSELIMGLSFPALAVSGSDLFVCSLLEIGEYTTGGTTVNGSLIEADVADASIAVFGSNLFVTNYGDSTISEFSTSRATVNSELIKGLANPDGIAIEAAPAAGPAAQLSFGQQVGNIAAGTPISPAVTVAIEDQDGNIVSTDDAVVTLSGPAGTSILGTASIAAVNGVATFDDVSFGTAGAYTLTANDAADALPAITSNPFMISPASGPGTGDIFVPNLDGVAEYTSSGATLNPALVSGLTGPHGIAVFGSDLFVTNYGDGLHGTVGEYTTAGATINASLISGLAGPGDIAVSGSDLFVMSGLYDGSGTIGEYTTTGGTINASLISITASPVAMAISGTNIYVVTASGTIGEYTTSGATVNTALVSGLTNAQGIAVAGLDLFVTNFGGTVSEYTTAGAPVNSALISGLIDPSRVAAFGSALFVVVENAIGEYSTSGATVNAALISGVPADAIALQFPEDPTFAPDSGNVAPLTFSAEQVLQEPDGQVLTIGHEGNVAQNTSQGVLEQLNTDGTPDASFGLDGIMTTPPLDNYTFQSAALETNGQIVVVGTSDGSFLAARYDVNGSLDTTFGNGGFATIGFGVDGAATASTVAIQTNEDIVIGGEVGSAADATNVFAIARFTAAGDVDPSFNAGGGDDLAFPSGGQRTISTGSAGTIQQIAIDAAGQILGVGDAGAAVAVFRLDPDGANDAAFGTGGIAIIDQLSSKDPNGQVAIVEGIALQPDGDILVAGEHKTGGLAAVRLTPNGQFDSTFGDNGISAASFGGTHDETTGISADLSNGQFLLVGTSNVGAGTNQIAVAAFNPDGTVNAAFGQDGQVLLPAPNGAAGQSGTAESVTPALIRPLSIHVQLIDFVFATIGKDEKPIVGGSGMSSASLTRFNALVPSSSTSPPPSPTRTLIGDFGRDGRKNTRLPAFTLPDGVSVTITSTGGSGTAYNSGNSLVELDLSGTISVTIRTRGSNSLGLSSVTTTAGTLHALNAPTAILAGMLSTAGTIAMLKLGSITGVVVAGGIASLSANSLSGSVSCSGILGTAKIGTVNGTIAASVIHSFTAVDLSDATILAGANLGDDGEIGGTGSGADTYGAGQLYTLSVSGSIANSFIGAGVNPVDGNFGNGDDISAGPGSFMRSISVKKGIDATTRFEAGAFPRTVHLPAKTATAGDAQFIVLM